ncbi:MAG: hypothetical protein JNK72_22645 [Myxococcales bacterium]|nr:hypothetical protein [Myxococcales bacterium]
MRGVSVLRLGALCGALAGCGVRYGQVGAYYAAAAGPPTSQGASVSWAGVARSPVENSVLTPVEGTGQCFEPANLRAQFGATCRNREAEAPATASGEAGRETWWYCDHRTVVRMVVERCDGRGGFMRVVQIAVTLDRG